MAKPKNHTLLCPFCAEVLDVGDEKRAIVAVCNKTGKACTLRQWGSASTRVGYGDPEKPSHALQLNPQDGEEETAQEGRAA